MRLRHLSIKHFRGVSQLSWAIRDTGLLCLIGCGDSTKSTVLEAIRRVLHPQWNLAFDDADFHKCDITVPIIIDVLLGSLPDSYCDLTNGYGQHLSGWDKEALVIHHEPADGLEEALHVRLTVDKSLEPQWHVIRSGTETGVPFKSIDRAKAAASLIENRPDYHLTWGRGSILNQVTENGNLSDALAEAGRAARSALDARRASSLSLFDTAAKQAEGTARTLGVKVDAGYKAHLDSSAINVKQGALALHDGDMPLRQLGLGSRRLLSTGIVRVAKDSPHITLFDEIEVGLEPHRIARLIRHLKDDRTGQYFVTTHSPVAVRELDIDDLHICHHKGGVTEVHSAKVAGTESILQGRIRTYAEAFLAPKVLVCEGATEVGILRALDRIWQGRELPSFAYQGVAPIAAGSDSQVFLVATQIKVLKYDVAVFADSDGKGALTEAQLADLTQQDMAAVVWEDKLCTEKRFFLDLPWDAVKQSYELAKSSHGDDVFLSQVESQFGPGFNRKCSEWTDEPEIRVALGKAAHASEWFKSQSRAQAWILSIEKWLTDSELNGTALGRQLKSLREWIDRE